MEHGTEVQSVDAVVEPIDLNTATIAELRTLPGIGAALARRILDYREAHGPFPDPETIIDVPGVNRTLYERWAGRVTASPPETPPPLEVAEAAVERAEATPTPFEGEAELPPPIAEPEPEEVPASEPEPAPAEPEEALLPAPEAMPVLEPPSLPAPEPVEPKALPTALPEPRPAPAPEAVAAPRASGMGWLAWVLAVFLGGLLGMLFTLLVLSNINGSLDIANSRAVLGVQNQIDSLTAGMTSLQGDINGLRQRLDALEGLTARMERAESAVQNLGQDVTRLEQQAQTLSSELTSLSADMDRVKEQVQRAETFFTRLQSLLQELFGSGEPVPTTPTPAPQPTQ